MQNSTLFTQIASQECKIDKSEVQRFQKQKWMDANLKFSNFRQKLTFLLNKCGKHFAQIAFPKCKTDQSELRLGGNQSSATLDKN